MQEWFDNIFIPKVLPGLIVSAIIIIAAVIFIKIVRRIFTRHFSAMPSFPFKVIKTVIIMLAIFGILMQIEPLRAFSVSIFAGSGVAAVIIGLAAQEAIGNIICGFVILFNKPVDIGEYITIPGSEVSGTIEDISLRHTVIRGADNKRFIVPNSVMNKQVLYSSYSKDPYICSPLCVSVSYDVDIEHAIKVIQEETDKHPRVLDTRTPEQKSSGVPKTIVRVSDLGSTSIELKALVWTTTVTESFSVLSDLRIAVLNRFKAEGIEIPYPYINVIMNDK